jgi:hypothetical protein
MVVLYSLFLASLIPLASAPTENHKDEFNLVLVERTPEGEAIETRIVFPEVNSADNENPITVQLRLEGYPIGFYSDFPRAQEIRSNEEGQSIHILIDDYPLISLNEAIDDVSDTEDVDFDQILTSRLPFTLAPGPHLIRTFPVRSFGESLKGAGCFNAGIFYIGPRTRKTIDLTHPYITYNQPIGDYAANMPILLDFYLSNTQLSEDGYKVRLTVDGENERLITDWEPYYLYGLKPGKHRVSLELLGPQGKVLPPLFHDTQRTITIR